VCRHTTQTLPSEPRTAGAARDLVRERFAQWDLVPLVDDVLLVVSELVTNAVLHARPPVTLSLACESGTVELAVADGDPRPPTARPRRADLAADLDQLREVEADGAVLEDRDARLHVGPAGAVAGGRGLLLVAALCDDWGVTRTAGGKAVWGRCSAPADWWDAAGCACAQGQRGVQLASGRWVVHR
jgi:anti-sigma regulatory factor (Ser/Thr protein kinase)